ncbi:hypothetical protein KAH94_06710 [bacterium]|nr:hypothetical protein [bacterium]
MLKFGVDFEGKELKASLEAAGDEKAFSNSSAEGMALAYKWFVRKGYISGQVLDSVTGELQKAYKYKKTGTGTFTVYPGTLNYIGAFQTGALITPVTSKVLRFFVEGIPIFTKYVNLPKKPFIDQSFNAFVGSGKAQKKAIDIVNSMLKDRGF